MSVVLEISVKQKTTEIVKDSGNIWDRCECPSTLNSMQIREIESAWSSIPKKHTDGISDVNIYHTHGVSGGLYIPHNTYPNIRLNTGSVGSTSTIHHEVHHHMWETKRSSTEKTKFRKGVRKLMNEYGKSPTHYSDSYGKQVESSHVKKQHQMLAMCGESISNETPTIELAKPDYERFRSIAKKNARFKKISSKETVYNLNREEARLDRIACEYNSLPDKEKMNLVRKNHARLKEKLDAAGPAKYTEIFYNEVHSEVGAYINAEDSMRTRANLYNSKKPKWDHRINDDVIDKYIDLYRNVFE